MSVLLSYIVDNIDINGIIFSFDVIPYAKGSSAGIHVKNNPTKCLDSNVRQHNL